MNVGMLWLDDDGKRSLAEKVNRAVDYYEEKYGCLPEMCLVNKAMLPAEMHVGNINVLPTNNILPHHFWLGMKAN